MDNSSTAGNIVARPHAKAAMGGVAVGKSVSLPVHTTCDCT